MNGYHADIESLTKQNATFRTVLYTGKLQLVLMTLKPGEEIGMEVHKDVDQFFRFEEGEGKVVIDMEVTMVKNGDVVIVPAGCQHNVVNISSTMSLRLYTIYSPPNHPPGTVHATKSEAEAAEAAKGV